MTVELNEPLFVLAVCVFTFILADNVWTHRLYKKAVNQLVNREDEIKTLKTKLHEVDEAKTYTDLFYSASSVYNKDIAHINPTILRTGITAAKDYKMTINGKEYPMLDMSIKVDNTAKKGTHEILQEIFTPREIDVSLGYWLVPFKWNHNTYEQLNNAMRTAGEFINFWEHQQKCRSMGYFFTEEFDTGPPNVLGGDGPRFDYDDKK